MIKMAISALSELIEELKTPLAPLEHTFQCPDQADRGIEESSGAPGARAARTILKSFADDLQEATQTSYNLLEMPITHLSFTNTLLFLQAELESQ